MLCYFFFSDLIWIKFFSECYERISPDFLKNWKSTSCLFWGLQRTLEHLKWSPGLNCWFQNVLTTSYGHLISTGEFLFCLMYFWNSKQLLLCSIALCFFKNSSIMDCPGVVEVPVDLVLEEIVKFTIPCILKIIDNELLLGGSMSSVTFSLEKNACS